MYDDRPSPLVRGLVLFLAWLATYLVGPALASFWHIGDPPGWVLGTMALFAVAAAYWPWLNALLVPGVAGVLYALPWLREGLYLDLTVWYTDVRLGFWPSPPGTLAWVAVGLVMLGLGLLFLREPLRSGRALWSFLLGTLLMGHMWLWGDDLVARQYTLWLLALLPLWVAGAVTAREQAWWKAGRRVVEQANWVGPAVAALLVAGLAGWLLPAPGALHLGAASVWLRQTFPALEQMRGPGGEQQGDPQGFTIASAGFARRLSELGGPIKPDTDVAMRVRVVEGSFQETLYLRGTAMTNYTGRGWAQETRPGSINEDDAPPMGEELTLEITPVQMGGNTIFYPRELMSVVGVEFQFGRESFIFSRERLTGPYRVQSYQPGGRPVVSGPPLYDPGRYLALPKSLPDRVRHLAQEVTAGKATPYDEALAIEAYLRTFEYAMDVPATPPGRDFADHFLFDLKRGYCAYSATAMVVMLRSVGIPARWVQGFAVEPGRVETEVPWSSAHAWVEAFFPGYGWAVFDPTPRFALPARLATETAVPVTVPVITDGLAPDVAPLDPSVRPDTATETQPFPWLWAVGALAAAGWLAASFRRFYRERIDWRDERTGLLRAFALLSAALRSMGLPRKAHQTPIEYARSVAGAWPEVGATVAQAAADATAAMYATPLAPAPEGARRRMGGALAGIWLHAQQRWGRIRTVWIRFRFLWGKD